MFWVCAIQLAPTGQRWSGFIEWWHDTAWIWFLVGVVVFSVASMLRHGDLIAMDATNAILDKIQDALFGDSGDDDAHHRVTLFKRERKWLWLKDASGHRRRPGRRWLSVVARSGYGTKNTTVRFRCPDDTDQAEGVAGRAWARSTALPVQDLPDLKSPRCSDEDRRSYAKQTFVPVEWVQEEQPAARSLMGFRVDDVKSAPWGVLVIDSRSPTFDTQRAQEEFRAYARVLAQLVQSM